MAIGAHDLTPSEHRIGTMPVLEPTETERYHNSEKIYRIPMLFESSNYDFPSWTDAARFGIWFTATVSQENDHNRKYTFYVSKRY